MNPSMDEMNENSVHSVLSGAGAVCSAGAAGETDAVCSVACSAGC